MTLEQRLRVDALRELYAYWRELRSTGGLPAWAQIHPARITDILPHIGLFDVERAPRRYRIRVMGMEIVTWYGCDLTGRYLDEIDFGDRRPPTFRLLDQVVDRLAPGHMTGEYTSTMAERFATSGSSCRWRATGAASTWCSERPSRCLRRQRSSATASTFDRTQS